MGLRKKITSLARPGSTVPGYVCCFWSLRNSSARERVAYHGECFATSGLPMRKDTGPSSLEKSRYQTLDGILIDSKIVSVFIKNIIKTKWEINSGFGLINQNLSKCVTSGDE